VKSVGSVNTKTDVDGDGQSSSKERRVSSASLRKASSLEFETVPPLVRRLVAPRKTARITRDTPSDASDQVPPGPLKGSVGDNLDTTSSPAVGTRKDVGSVRSDQTAVRTTRVKNCGAESDSESGGQ